ncbi:membrane-associated phospholipid phosphatase [Kibdelosporangium banguiense]|uniref:Membrane-associated phospholipid phosphatase n=1 Tax=Kibdelosporangium banguiense TaxID=1365924 RepID=A0ABS4TPF0_9PSEU|nr:phosphatase PAP2 family protein [Kibdelosporangium banguiense]MBP2326281.1 membrane-associated phospholipid phosphatase [Kibdelosporangium banguiense]
MATVVTYLVLVRTAEGQATDHTVLSWFDPTLTRMSGEVPWPLKIPVTMLFAGTLFVVCAIGLSRRAYRRTVMAALLMGVTAALAQLLKSSLERPDLAHQIRYTENSFPSGHVTVAAVCVFALLLVVPANVRLIVAAPGLVWIGAVGVSTLVTGWHRPSDFLGAVLLAASCYAVATAFVVESTPAPIDRPQEHALMRHSLNGVNTAKSTEWLGPNG